MVIAINQRREGGSVAARLIGASDARIVIGADETMRDPDACRAGTQENRIMRI